MFYLHESGGYTKSIQGLDSHFSLLNDHNNHLAIMKLIHFSDAPDQKWEVQNDLLDKGFKTEPDKKNIFPFLCPDFGKTFW